MIQKLFYSTITLLFIFSSSVVKAQIVYINDDAVLEKAKVKKRQTLLYKTEDTTGAISKVFKETEFNRASKPTKDYFYIFFDVVPYSHTKTFTYDENNQVIETLRTQSLVKEELTASHRAFLIPADMEDSYDKNIYEYDSLGNCIKRTHYSYGGLGSTKFDPNDPLDMVIYEYKDGLLVTETGKGTATLRGLPNNSFGSSSSDYISTYQYDEKGMLIKKTTLYHTLPNKPTAVTVYTYNENGNLIEEKETHGISGVSEKHVKYEYDKEGRKIKELSYSERTNKWEESKYEYNNAGNQIPQNTDDEYIFYKNGLLRQRIVRVGNSVYNFVTTYEYYED